MTPKTKEPVILDKYKDLEDFAEYLGIDCEDLYELHGKKNYEDIEFDDWSN